MLLFVKTLRATSLQVGLLERVLTQSLATQSQILHVARHLLAEVLVHIQLGEVLAEHEAVAAQAGEDTDLRVDDVTRLGVTTSPASQEAHFAQVGNPLGEDLGDDLQELLAVVLDVLACLVSVGVGAGAADDLASVGPLLSVDGAEALVVTAVDDHVERTTIGSHHGQTARDEGLVLHWIETCV